MFRSLLEAGEELAPIEVVRWETGKCLIADGVHRTLAAGAAGRSEILAVTVEPLPGESVVACAYRRALETASRAALPLTLTERRQAAHRLLAEQPDRSHREIARMVGVSHDSVDRWARAAAAPANDGSRDAAFPDPAAARLISALLRLRGSSDEAHSAQVSPVGERLADALEARLGESALDEARHLMAWTAAAVDTLEHRSAMP
jgi:ParB-like chromosome segregation protein Spo0J